MSKLKDVSMDTIINNLVKMNSANYGLVKDTHLNDEIFNTLVQEYALRTGQLKTKQEKQPETSEIVKPNTVTPIKPNNQKKSR